MDIYGNLQQGDVVQPKHGLYRKEIGRIQHAIGTQVTVTFFLRHSDDNIRILEERFEENDVNYFPKHHLLARPLKVGDFIYITQKLNIYYRFEEIELEGCRFEISKIQKNSQNDSEYYYITPESHYWILENIDIERTNQDLILFKKMINTPHMPLI